MAIQGSKIDSSIPAVAAVAAADRVQGQVDQSRTERVEPVAPVQQPKAAPRPVQEEDLRRVRQAIAERLDQYMKESGRSVEFRVDDDIHETVITVRRTDTGEVVRQYPTDEAIALLRRLNEQSGTFVDLFA